MQQLVQMQGTVDSKNLQCKITLSYSFKKADFIAETQKFKPTKALTLVHKLIKYKILSALICG